MKRLFAKLFGKQGRPQGRAGASAAGARLRLETLEERANPSSFLASGDLYVFGTNADEAVTVSVKYFNNVGYYDVDQSGVHTYFQAARVTGGDLNIYTYGGNDQIYASTVGLRVNAYGGDGNDWIDGGLNYDYLDGGRGIDRLAGGAGNDTLVGGYDNSANYLYAGAGNDKLYGGYGNDLMYGDAGSDSLNGSFGADKMYGGDGVDFMYGEAGNDEMRGGDDDAWNYMDGGDGNDTMFGSYGSDLMYGRGGDDVMNGGWGNDNLDGGAGSDRLYGTVGDDYLNGGANDGVADYLDGDVGADRFEVDYVWNGTTWANRDTPFDYYPFSQGDQLVNYY